MSNIGTNLKDDLDKLIIIARKYRDDTIGISMFYDVIYNVRTDKSLCQECRKYIEDNGISIIDEDSDVEEDAVHGNSN